MSQGSLFGDAPPRHRDSVDPVALSASVARIAGRLPAGLPLGTSSWSFPGWQGIVYGGKHSKTLLSRRGLAAYSRHPLLRAAGIDRTYYGPIPAAAFASYAKQVPDRFRFTVKAHEYCTLPRFPAMDRYGERAGGDNQFFLHPGYASDEVIGPCVEGLGDKLGVLLCQPAYAVELRRSGLFGDAYLKALQDSGAVHCHNVHPSMPSVGDQLRAGSAERGPVVFVRWMLHSGFSYGTALERYEPFDRLVDEDTAAREEIAGLCRIAAAAGRDAFVIANNKAEGSAPLTVFKLAERLADTS